MRKTVTAVADKNDYKEPDYSKVEKLYRWYDRLARYHRHSVVGMNNIPASGPALLVVNHSAATYDISLLMAAVYRETERLVWSLGDDMWFNLPGIGNYIAETGAVRASNDTADRLLKEGKLVLVAPGGMREALKPSSEKNVLHWQDRKGFVRLALRSQTPVILCACPAADDIFSVYENSLTKLVYKKWRLPLPLFRGIGISPLPRPVRLTHYMSEVMQPPVVDPADTAAFEQAVESWHAELTTAMNSMLQPGV